MTPIHFSDVSVSYGQDEPWIIHELYCEVEETSSIGIIGGNGSGKSTLAHALVGIIPHVTPGRVEGKAFLNESDLFNLGLDDRLVEVGYSFQDVESQVLFGKVSDVIGLHNEATDYRLVEQAIHRLRISHLLERDSDQLSGGEAQRVALATALRLGPQLVIYDEAISALDPHARHDFGLLVDSLVEKDRTVFSMGQRPSQLESHCEKLLSLKDGKLVSSSLDLPSEEDARTFWNNAMKRSSGPHPPSLSLEEIRYKREGSSDFTLGPISLTVSPGEIVAIVGPNGSGKTTIFDLLSSVLKADSGSFMLNSQEYNTTRSDPWPSLVDVVPQSPTAQIVGETVGDELFVGTEVNAAADESFKSDLLTHFPYLQFDRDPLQLSFGQQRVLTMLRAILGVHPIILIDEPEQGLDSQSLEYIVTWIERNKIERMKSVMFSTHNLTLAANLADRTLLLVGGRLRGETKTSNAQDLRSWYFDLV